MSTDGFYTACTTCSARLKVRDLSAIGQIFACPKCGSMVLVEPPEGMETPAADAELVETPGEAVPQSAGLQPADWSTAASSGTSWLPIAFGSVATIVVLGGIVTFAWLRYSNTQDVSPPIASATNSVPLEDANDVAPDPATSELIDEVDVDQNQDSVAAIIEPGQPVTDEIKVQDIFEQVAVVDPDNSNKTDLLNDQAVAPTIATAVAPEIAATEQPSSADSNTATLSNLASLLADSPTAETVTDLPPANAGVVHHATATPTKLMPASSSTIAKQIDVNKALDRRIPAVRFEKKLLTEFVRTMMQMSGVPIQIDPAALEQTNNRPNSPISIAMIDKSVLQILQQSLKPLNLVPIVEKNGVRISSPRIEDQTPTKAVFSVADLLVGKGTDLDLAHLVSTLIEPQSWSTSVAARGRGAGTIVLRGKELHVTNSRRVSIKTLVLLEKLRAARGLRPQKKIPAHLLALQPRWNNIERYMNRSVNLNVWQPSPWTDVLNEIEAVTGLKLLVDWQALADVGIGSETNASLHARDTQAGTVFESFLDSYDLALIPVDNKTLQLTSKTAMSKQPYIEFYSIKRLGDDGMSVVEELMLSGKAALDSVSEFALVVADSSIHRSLAN